MSPDIGVLKQMLDQKTEYLGIFLILVLGAYLSLGFFYGPSWINGSDNFVYTSEAHALAYNPHTAYFGDEDNVKFLIYAGIIPFYLLLGYGPLSSALFGVTCFLGNVLTVYILGKKLYSPTAGMVAAFLYATLPLVIAESSNVGDDVPATFFVSLAILFAVLAMENGKRRNLYYALAGFLSAISYLAVPEGAIGALFVLLLFGVIAVMTRKKEAISGLFFGTLGSVCAFTVVILIGIVLQNPLAVIVAENANLNAYSTVPGFLSYLGWMLPVQFVQASLLSGYLPIPTPQSFSLLLNYVNRYSLESLIFGYLGFVFFLSAIYLIASNERKSLVPLFWFSFVFAYLGLGSQSLTRYLPVLTVSRFLILLCPAIALVVGIALSKALEFSRKKRPVVRFAITFAIIYFLVLTLLNSYFSVMYIQYSQYNAMVPLIETGNYINSLSPNATITGPVDIPWDVYTNYTHAMVQVGYARFETNCSVVQLFQMQPGYYFVGMNNSTLLSCGLAPVFTPYPVSWLRNYTLFTYWGMNFSNFAIYRYQ
ncbi:MAG: glycosyltransferase family 39 protein [Candidatus Micrarchaeota archaeon]|nr:glycosyltransferase family 39 protein [Candidatus Micrarchaeota archaeon]